MFHRGIPIKVSMEYGTGTDGTIRQEVNMTEKQRLLDLLKRLSYEEGDFTLTSGKKSTFYIDCKETTLNPEGMYLVGHLMLQRVIKMPGIEAVGGVSIGGDPLVC